MLSNENIKEITIDGNTPAVEYANFTSGTVKQVTEIFTAIYDPGTTDRALQRIHPRQIDHTLQTAAGPPYYYYLFGEKFGIYPTPTATENAKTINVYCSLVTENITNIPDTHSLLVIDYAVAAARFKERKNAIDEYLSNMTLSFSEMFRILKENS